jgi:hypothetical protein
MDAQIKAKWVEALRSGDYAQCKNYLRHEGGFCCLGVLCDVAGDGRWQPSDLPDVEHYRVSDTDYNTQYLPHSLKLRCGINSDQCDPLMTMNDEGKSFAEIADYIEANL